MSPHPQLHLLGSQAIVYLVNGVVRALIQRPLNERLGDVPDIKYLVRAVATQLRLFLLG